METLLNKEVFGAEFIRDVWRESLPLMHEHWDEIAHYKDIPLDPDFEQYKFLDDNKILRVFTIREEGKLIGYALFFVKPNIHYKSSLQAFQDVIFISKKYRGIGKKFIKWCDEMLSREGVQIVHHHVKKDHNFGPLLNRMNYELVDLIYSKRL